MAKQQKSSAPVSNLTPAPEGATSTALVPATAPGLPSIYTLQMPAGFESMKRRNLPQMILPKDVPIGAIIDGEILDVVDSPVTTVKGKLLHLRVANGQEICFPVTGVVRQALIGAYDKDKDDKEGSQLMKLLQKEIGQRFIAKKCPGRESAKYKKEMFVFEVFTGPMPKAA